MLKMFSVIKYTRSVHLFLPVKDLCKKRRAQRAQIAINVFDQRVACLESEKLNKAY